MEAYQIRKGEKAPGLIMEYETLKKFCASLMDPRYYLHEPFNGGQYTYATNGRIAIRVQKAGDYAAAASFPAGGDLATRLDEYISRSDRSEFMRLDHVSDPELVNCMNCKGSGRNVQCGLCDGSGEVECDYGHFHDCPDCDGRGVIASSSGENCAECGGSGKVLPRRTPWISVGESAINQMYASWIRDLDAEIAMPKSKADPIYFRFPGGEGVVMPMALSLSSSSRRIN